MWLVTEGKIKIYIGVFSKQTDYMELYRILKPNILVLYFFDK